VLESTRPSLVWNLLWEAWSRTKGMQKTDLSHYFEYSNAGIDVVEDGLKEMTFGEFLVENRAIDRYQLLCALQMQDSNPGVRLGECIAALGYLPYLEIEKHLASWKGVAVIETA
jgi:hypothetical protein